MDSRSVGGWRGLELDKMMKHGFSRDATQAHGHGGSHRPETSDDRQSSSLRQGELAARPAWARWRLLPGRAV